MIDGMLTASTVTCAVIAKSSSSGVTAAKLDALIGPRSPLASGLVYTRQSIGSNNNNTLT